MKPRPQTAVEIDGNPSRDQEFVEIQLPHRDVLGQVIDRSNFDGSWLSCPRLSEVSTVDAAVIALE